MHYELSYADYQQIVLEGSPYQAGRDLASIWRTKDRLRFCTQPVEFDAGRFGYGSLAEMQAALERFVPGFNDEMQGFADELAIPIDRVFHYSANSQAVRGCSHMAVHPAMTRLGRPLLGRSYELAPNEEDRGLVTSRIEGRTRSMGFSTIIFGRLDGINEHGLAATMSASIAPPQREPARGFDFWVFMRAVLDTCHNVAEALDLLNEFPLNAYTNFIFVDAGGDGVLIESAGCAHAIQRLDGEKQPYLIAANHYTLPGMTVHNLDRNLDFSVPRYNAIRRCLDHDKPLVTYGGIKEILSRESPNGSYCPYYARFGMGTLWSEVFYPAEQQMEVVFGSVSHNPWQLIRMTDGAPGAHEYMGVLATKFEKKV